MSIAIRGTIRGIPHRNYGVVQKIVFSPPTLSQGWLGIPECKLNFYSGDPKKVWVNVHTSHSMGVC